jgi:hypothetical protein
MNDERRVPFEMDEQILRATIQPAHASALSARLEKSHTHRITQPAIVNMNAFDTTPGKARFKAAANGFNFGKLGHASLHSIATRAKSTRRKAPISSQQCFHSQAPREKPL